MKNGMKIAMVGTITGIMAAAAPITCFAAEKDTKPAIETEVETDAAAEEGFDFNVFLEDMNNLDYEELCTRLGELKEAVVEDKEFRAELIESVLGSVIDYAEVEVEDGKIQEVAEELANITAENAEAVVADVAEFFTSDEMSEVYEKAKVKLEADLEKVKEEMYKQSIAELDESLEELGQMLIDITQEDLMELFS